MKILIIIIGIVILFSALLLWSNHLYSFFHEMKRFHIGRWESEKKWEGAVEKCTLRWSNKEPAIKTTSNTDYILLDILKGKYRNAAVQSWQSAELLLGIYEYEGDNAGQTTERMISRYIATDGSWRVKVDKVDYSLLSYAILKTTKDPNMVKPAMQSMLEVIRANLCSDGMISYSQGSQSPLRYVDTLGMVCPFLALYGEVYNEKEYVHMAIDQIEKFRECGILIDTQLPCHAYHADRNVPVGIYGWGRGTAWYFLALLETWSIISDDLVRNRLYSYIEMAADSYITFQQPDGGFSTILQGGGQYDSSVTAAMAYFYMCYYKMSGNAEYKEVADRALRRLKQSTMKSGAIDCCQGDTHGLGIFSQSFDIMPFAQGLVMRALAIKKEQG